MLAPDCSVSACDRVILAMTPADIARFWSKVDRAPGHGPKGECWVWTGGQTTRGYGKFWAGGRTLLAHRVGWILAIGQPPPQETPCILHKCDNPLCVREGDLWAGTKQDNNIDRDRKGRQASGDSSGARKHPEKWARGDRHFSRTRPELLARGNRNGSRTCPQSRPRGEANPRAKLTNDQVLAMRAQYAAGARTGDLTVRYGIDRTVVWEIVTRRSWTHI